MINKRHIFCYKNSKAAGGFAPRSPLASGSWGLSAPDPRLRPGWYSGGRGAGGIAPPFGQKRMKIHKRNAFKRHFCDFRGLISQAVPDPELTKTQNFCIFDQNYECFQIVLEKILNEFDQK